MKLNDTAIILQGYSVDNKQMEDLVRYYKNNGLNNIVVSSYSSCLNEYVKKNTVFLANDDVSLGEVASLTNSTINEGGHRGAKGHEFIARTEEEVPQAFDSNLNYQILTTKRGVSLAKEAYPQCDYYLKLRADQKLEDLHEYIPKWKKKIEKTPNDIFEKRLLTFAWGKNGRRVCWYITDYWTFGCKKDIINYYNIPYNTIRAKPVCSERYLSYKYVSSKIKARSSFDEVVTGSYDRKDENFEKILEENWEFDRSIKNFSYKWGHYVNDKCACYLDLVNSRGCQ